MNSKRKSLLTLCALMFLLSCKRQPNQTDIKAITVAGYVSSAVDSFHHDHGRWPKSLGEVDLANYDYEARVKTGDIWFKQADSDYSVYVRSATGRIAVWEGGHGRLKDPAK